MDLAVVTEVTSLGSWRGTASTKKHKSFAGKEPHGHTVSIVWAVNIS